MSWPTFVTVAFIAFAVVGILVILAVECQSPRQPWDER